MLEMEMKPAELVVDFGKAVSRKKKQKHNSLFFLLKRERERETWTEGNILLSY